jgi:UDP-glucose 4-epimerase
MKYLITGGSGFIGSHLTAALLNRGDSVVALDDLSTGSAKNLEGLASSSDLEIVSGSILDSAFVDSLVAKVDHVLHLAAAVGVFNIVNNPLKSLETNIGGTENVLDACAKYNKPFFLTSSSEIYGKNTNVPLSEDSDRIVGSPLKSRWSYSEAKAIDESLAYFHYTQKKLPIRIVRLFNTVGPRQIGQYGMVVPRFVSAAISGEVISVYGDGKQTRSFCHIDDVIEALLLVIESPKAIGQVYNVGNNFEISISDLATKIIEVTKSASKIEFKPYSDAYGSGFEDLERRVPDISKIKADLGWAPKRDLTQVIEDIAHNLKNS